ncbi:MAG: phosphoribosylformylglycinamidine synthase [Candidatus Nomurabacteria bacterium]|jgi:phosphoribosylformylglycinamidine synthase|nr:phosphoribosylformylglycinamidine synthase [Candidatus Nomurabacteria bacterium]
MQVNFFGKDGLLVYVVISTAELAESAVRRLEEYFLSSALLQEPGGINGPFVGPRTSMETPWSTNAVAAIGDPNIVRIEKYEQYGGGSYDPMLQEVLTGLSAEAFLSRSPATMFREVDDITAFNQTEGLALSTQEISYLHQVAQSYGRHLTDCEIFLFAQINSEHCRHKIFNGEFIIDGTEKSLSLFQLIKSTYPYHGFNGVASAYVDNSAAFGLDRIFILQSNAGILQPANSRIYTTGKVESHNHPTGVSASAGAGTGTGGEIRDRMGTGRGSWPLAGGAAYFVPELRLYGDTGSNMPARSWLYQDPIKILIRASNGASDYGNKIGQPLINGSVLPFEHRIGNLKYGFDKPIMLASGFGCVKHDNLEKREPEKGMIIVLLGGKNYRIGVGGGSSSSVNLGAHNRQIELNSVQRPDPEMQRLVMKVIDSFARFANYNPIQSVHDHGAGGHGNCFAELVGKAGGEIWLDALPLGDNSLIYKEIIGNESQERMGILIEHNDWGLVKQVAAREKCPAYVVGRITGSGRFVFKNRITGETPFDMAVEDLIGNPPKTIMGDTTIEPEGILPLEINQRRNLHEYLEAVLRRGEVSSKSYLTSKVDRSVSGLVTQQQCVGQLQVPVADYGLSKKDYIGHSGIAMSQGSAPVPSLINVTGGVRLALAEALTNIIFSGGQLSNVSLSANWMWPCRNPGEDARLYAAVEALSEAVKLLGISVITGKDSLSMTQKYPDGDKVIAPGTVIISAFANIEDVRRAVTPELKLNEPNSKLILIDMSDGELQLGGSSFALSLNQLGDAAPQISLDSFKRCYAAVNQLIRDGLILAGHDVSDGGLITTLLEMCFAAGNKVSIKADDDTDRWNTNVIHRVFAQNPGLVLQVKPEAMEYLQSKNVSFMVLGSILPDEYGTIDLFDTRFNVEHFYALWSETSLRLECHQTNADSISLMRKNLGRQPLGFSIPKGFTGSYDDLDIRPLRDVRSGIVAAVIRDEGTNGELEMQNALRLAGFDVIDVTMTDLISGRETLDGVRVIVFAGGFSNSDVLGSATGWAGKFKFNENAKEALDNFLARTDTLCLGICNGCQLMVKLGIIDGPKLALKANNSGRFESAFVNVDIPEDTNSIWLKRLAGSRLGVWVAHGEGRFVFDADVSGSPRDLGIALRYSYTSYPANPNGSDYSTAGISSRDGRFLAMMPHPERCIYPVNWPFYPAERRYNDVTPWLMLFTSAFEWCRG